MSKDKCIMFALGLILGLAAGYTLGSETIKMQMGQWEDEVKVICIEILMTDVAEALAADPPDLFRVKTSILHILDFAPKNEFALRYYHLLLEER